MKTGFYWCAYHDFLLIFLSNPKQRLKTIEQDKPRNERKIRKSEMQRVKGKLPKEVIITGKKCTKAFEVYFKAFQVYFKALKVHIEFPHRSRIICHLEETKRAFEKSYNVFVNAINKHKDYLEKLHREEVPNSCWDGERLAFEKNKR